MFVPVICTRLTADDSICQSFKTQSLVPIALPKSILQISFPQELHVACLSLHEHINEKKIQLHVLPIRPSTWLVKNIYSISLSHYFALWLCSCGVNELQITVFCTPLCHQHCGEVGSLMLMFVYICKWRYSLAMTAAIFPWWTKTFPRALPQQ